MQISAIFSSVQRWWWPTMPYICPKSPPRPGVTRHGKPFDTCCRGCALGSCCPVLGLLSVATWLGMPGMSMILCVVGSTPQRQERVAGNDSYTPVSSIHGFTFGRWGMFGTVAFDVAFDVATSSIGTSILLGTFEYSIVWRYIFTDELQNSAIVLS